MLSRLRELGMEYDFVLVDTREALKTPRFWRRCWMQRTDLVVVPLTPEPLAVDPICAVAGGVECETKTCVALESLSSPCDDPRNVAHGTDVDTRFSRFRNVTPWMRHLLDEALLSTDLA